MCDFNQLRTQPYSGGLRQESASWSCRKVVKNGSLKTIDVFTFLVHSIFLSFVFDLELQHCIELICCVLGLLRLVMMFLKDPFHPSYYSLLWRASLRVNTQISLKFSFRIFMTYYLYLIFLLNCSPKIFYNNYKYWDLRTVINFINPLALTQAVGAWTAEIEFENWQFLWP